MDDTPSNNVISFPKVKKSNPDAPGMPSIKEVHENILDLKENEIVEMTEVLGTMIVEALDLAGFKVSVNEQNTPVLCFFIEALKSMIAKQYGMDHPFHDIAYNCFVKNEDGNIFFREPQFKFTETGLDETDDEIETDGEQP